MKNSTKIILLIFIISIPLLSYCQEGTKSSISVSLGSDFVSRYIWRGQPLEQSFCVQPTFSITYGNISVGSWGSYSLTKDQFDEHDLYLSYTQPTSSGNFMLQLYDYHNPNRNIKFSNFDKNNGGHTIELSLNYIGTESVPLALLLAKNIIGGSADPDNSTYFELGYNCTVEKTKLSLTIGSNIGKSTAWYGINEKNSYLINLGLTGTKNIKISNDFSLPISIQYIYNGYVEKSFLVLKFSL